MVNNGDKRCDKKRREYFGSVHSFDVTCDLILRKTVAQRRKYIPIPTISAPKDKSSNVAISATTKKKKSI